MWYHSVDSLNFVNVDVKALNVDVEEIKFVVLNVFVFSKRHDQKNKILEPN